MPLPSSFFMDLLEVGMPTKPIWWIQPCYPNLELLPRTDLVLEKVTSGRSATLAEQSNMLNQILQNMDNGKPITLIGHSYGGPLIVKMALDAPIYDNLVILAGALDPKAEKSEKWRLPLTWIPLKYLVPGALKPSNDELWWLKKELIALESSLEVLKARTLIIHGKKDKLVPYSNVPFMEKNFRNVDSLKVITLENENHFIVWTQEDLVKKSILEWVREN